MTGFVRSLQADKGFGFIRVEGVRDDYFFHKDDFNGDWNQLIMDYNLGNVEVTFEGNKTPKGPRASNVMVL